MGECPLSAIGLNHVFLTHAHGDHSRCLMRHDSLRKMMGVQRGAKYYIPIQIYEAACNWIKAEAMFEGVSEARFTLPELVAVEPGAWQALDYRPDLLYRGFPVKHSIPSLGFTIASHKRKLKEEYVGMGRNDIIALRESGVEITREVIEPRVTYIADCIGDSLIEQKHIWDSNIVIIECTFIEEDELTMARKKGHTHLQEIVQVLQTLGTDIKSSTIVLKHFSMKYARKHIFQKVDQMIPDDFKSRIKVFL